MGICVQSCERLGACNKQEQALSVLQHRTIGDPVGCPICEYVVVYIKEQLNDPETEKELIEQATQVYSCLVEHRVLARLLFQQRSHTTLKLHGLWRRHSRMYSLECPTWAGSNATCN